MEKVSSRNLVTDEPCDCEGMLDTINFKKSWRSHFHGWESLSFFFSWRKMVACELLSGFVGCMDKRNYWLLPKNGFLFFCVTFFSWKGITWNCFLWGCESVWLRSFTPKLVLSISIGLFQGQISHLLKLWFGKLAEESPVGKMGLLQGRQKQSLILLFVTCNLFQGGTVARHFLKKPSWCHQWRK